VRRLGIPDEFVEHGDPETLHQLYGYDADSIVRAALEMASVFPLLYIASYASEYNILVCCKSIHKYHLLERIRKHCEVMEVKFYLQKIGGQNSSCPKG